ncbi:MAG TPA: hypothetical protein VER96_26730 [Polyangiaceae bacterium]|nr:hypothetical protein [Polyangiaceae bacterium]
MKKIPIPWLRAVSNLALGVTCALFAIIAIVLLIDLRTQYRSIVGIGDVYISLIAFALIGTAFHRWDLFFAQVRWRAVRKASDALDSSQGAIVLVLRPFKGDAATRVRSSRWLLSARVLLENIIQECARDYLGCSAVALVNQSSGVLASGPHYLASSDELWMRNVITMMRRALAIVVVLPAFQEMTPSLRWELSQVRQLGLLSRVIILLPPASRAGYDQALRLLDATLATLLPDTGGQRGGAPFAIAIVRDYGTFELSGDNPQGYSYRNALRFLFEQVTKKPNDSAGNVIPIARSDRRNQIEHDFRAHCRRIAAHNFLLRCFKVAFFAIVFAITVGYRLSR